MNDYIEEENQFVRKHFDLEKVLNFTNNHRVQVVLGGDTMYGLYVGNPSGFDTWAALKASYKSAKASLAKRNGA